jgi:hypothetical protein
MSGHPNPFRDSKEVIPMDDKGLLEPSFAEAIAAIEQSLELQPPRRTHGPVRSVRSPRRWGDRLRVSLPAGVR